MSGSRENMNLPPRKRTAPKQPMPRRVGWCSKTGSLISGGIHIRQREPCCWAIPDLIGPPSGPVAGRIVVADPDLASSPSRHCASHFFRVAPDNLRVVSAHAPAFVRNVVVVSRFRRPRTDNLRRRCGRTVNLVQVLAVGRLWTMHELPARQEMVCPVLRACGQPIGPRQRRHPHARPHGVVDSEHVARERGCCGSTWPFTKVLPLCAADSVEDDQKPDRLPHASMGAHERIRAVAPLSADTGDARRRPAPPDRLSPRPAATRD
jgi:hypothetical protein